MNRWLPLRLFALATALWACDASEPQEGNAADQRDGGSRAQPTATDTSAADAAVPTRDGATPNGSTIPTTLPARLRSCAERGHPFPRTIDEAIEQVNALPRPVTLSCFLASLPRPLTLVMTDSIFSAQPAAGRRSPRIFIMGEPLILSVVPDGMGRDLLEFGERVSDTRTVKGEIEFPVYEELPPDAPYTRIIFDDNFTSCALCHREEWSYDGSPGAFESIAFRPDPDSLVSLDALRQEQAACRWEDEPFRCEMLDALLLLGEVREGAFDESVATFL